MPNIIFNRNNYPLNAVAVLPQAYDDKMYARYKEEGNEREMRKFRSSTDGPHASELLEDLKKRVYSTRDKVCEQ